MRRDLELDALRGTAILLVLFVHCIAVLAPPGAFRSIGGWLGTMGVDLFFVISGLLITGILLRTRDRPGYFQHFYLRRAQRILPLYMVFVGCYFGLVTLGALPTHDKLWLYPLFLQNTQPFAGLAFPWPSNISWSLCVEEHFYLVWPLLIAFMPRRSLAPICLAAIAISVVTRVAVAEQEAIVHLTTPARLDGLAIGSLLALGWRAERLSPWWIAAPVALAIATKAAGGLVSIALDKVAVSLAFGLVVAHRASLVKALARPALMYVGRRSYALYLVHPFVFVGSTALLPAVTPWTFLPIALGTTFLLAELSWRAIEQPVLRWKLPAIQWRTGRGVPDAVESNYPPP